MFCDFSYRAATETTYQGTAYECRYDPETGHLTGYSPDQEDDCYPEAATNCGGSIQKRARRAQGPSKLERLMDERKRMRGEKINAGSGEKRTMMQKKRTVVKA